jgi:S-(hydroxymethyl)glutathione dehydrogenase/alcohol dehydrogenase
LEFFGNQSKGILDENGTRVSCKGKNILQFLGCSTFSEFTVVMEHNLAKINDKAPLDIVCLISCGFTTGYGGAIKTANVKKGSTCAVWGLGTIGLACVVGKIFY